MKHLSEEIANTEAALTVAVRRRGGALPRGAAAPHERARPPAAAAASMRARCAATEEHLNPLHERAVARERRADRDLGAGSCSSSTSGSATTRAACTGRRRRFSPRPTTSTATASTRRCGAGWASRSTMRRRPTSPGSGARPSSTPGSPPSAPLPALRETLAGLGIDLDAPARTSSSTSRQRPGKRATGVLRADPRARPRRPRDAAAGRPGRLPGAVPRGRPRRALRRHAGRAPGRGRGCSATTPSPRASRSCSSTCWPIRPGCSSRLGYEAHGLRRASPPSTSSSSCAAMRPSWRTSSSCTRRTRAASGCRRATPSCSSAAVGVPYPADRLPRGRRRRLLLHVLPAGLGVRGPAARPPAHPLRPRPGSASPAPASCCARCGPRPVAAAPRRCCGEVAGGELDFGVLAAEAEAALARRPAPHAGRASSARGVAVEAHHPAHVAGRRVGARRAVCNR